jgi:hypothetical protein
VKYLKFFSNGSSSYLKEVAMSDYLFFKITRIDYKAHKNDNNFYKKLEINNNLTKYRKLYFNK